MIKENKNLQNTASAGDYLAPMVKVHEIKTRKVLCASNESYQDGGSMNDAFNN